MELIRCFIAIELPDELKLELTQLESRLKAGRQLWIKWVDPSSIHLTLKFLGNVVAERIDEITRIIETASRGIPPFHIQVKELGVFPDLRRIQVIWVGMTGELDKLGELQQRIEAGLEPLGFTPESRTFTPHLTLARVRREASLEERQKFAQTLASTTFESSHLFEVEAISLMRSQLTREGAIYSRISSVALSHSQR